MSECAKEGETVRTTREGGAGCTQAPLYLLPPNAHPPMCPGASSPDPMGAHLPPAEGGQPPSVAPFAHHLRAN